MSEKITAIDNEENLLTADLNDFADSDFAPPPAGAYRLALSISSKKIGDAQAVEFSYSVIDTLELADPTATNPKMGHKFSEAYRLNNEFGVSALKKAMKPLAAHFGVSNVGALIEQCQGIEVMATVAHRSDKTDPDKKYAKVSNLQIA